MSENPKSEVRRGSTRSRAPGAEKESGRKAWYTEKIEALERENRELKARFEGTPSAQQRMDALEAENAAQKHAIGQRLGQRELTEASIPAIAWLLVWQEYARRTKQFQFVGEHGLRSKADSQGNQWSILASVRVDGLSDDAADRFRQVGSVLGYDADDFPEDAFLLRCQPDRGMYEIACANIEKHQKAFIEAQKALLVAEKAVAAASERNDDAAARKARFERDNSLERLDTIARGFQECKAVIENAIERFWLIRIEDLEKMYEYGMELRCMSATVLPQKKHLSLPKWEPREAAIMPASGEMG